MKNDENRERDAFLSPLVPEVEKWVQEEIHEPALFDKILQRKKWGIALKFGDVVVKISFVPLFPQVLPVHEILEEYFPGNVAKLKAYSRRGSQIWTMFEYVDGPTVEEEKCTGTFLNMVRVLGRIQYGISAAHFQNIPKFELESVPELLLTDNAEIPEEYIAWLHDSRKIQKKLIQSLKQIPLSLDHPDVNVSNAILRYRDGNIVFIDWEETTIGCPLFSLDRIMYDAEEFSCTPDAKAAYIEGFQHCSPEQIEIALCLSPLKLAYEARQFARGTDMPTPHTRYTIKMLELSRQRIEALIH